MPVSNPSGATAPGAQPQPPDMQQLVALLGSLMPLLLRFQAQVVEPTPFQVGFANVAISDSTLDHQAAMSLVGDITADSLRNLSAYLEANAGRHEGLNHCVPIVTQAAHRFSARDYAQAFNLIWQTYRTITTIRAADPRIPPVQPAGQSSSDPTSSIH